MSSSVNLETTKGRIEAARATRQLRENGATWAQVTEAHGFSESTGRKLLKELDEYEAKKAKLRVVETESTEPPTTEDEAVEKAKQLLRDGGVGKPAPTGVRSGRYIKATCKCGTVIRLSQTNLDKGTIRCSECDTAFTKG